MQVRVGFGGFSQRHNHLYCCNRVKSIGYLVWYLHGMVGESFLVRKGENGERVEEVVQKCW